jgi:hypothetical protein
MPSVWSSARQVTRVKRNAEPARAQARNRNKYFVKLADASKKMGLCGHPAFFA